MLNGPGPIFLEDYSIRHVPNIGILEENRRLNGPGPISLEFSKKMACRMGRRPIFHEDSCADGLNVRIFDN